MHTLMGGALSRLAYLPRSWIPVKKRPHCIPYDVPSILSNHCSLFCSCLYGAIKGTSHTAPGRRNPSRPVRYMTRITSSTGWRRPSSRMTAKPYGSTFKNPARNTASHKCPRRTSGSILSVIITGSSNLSYLYSMDRLIDWLIDWLKMMPLIVQTGTYHRPDLRGISHHLETGHTSLLPRESHAVVCLWHRRARFALYPGSDQRPRRAIRRKMAKLLADGPVHRHHWSILDAPVWLWSHAGSSTSAVQLLQGLQFDHF